MEPKCLNSSQLQVGAPADAGRGNATMQFSWIITFRETKGLLGELRLDRVATAIPPPHPRLIPELHVSEPGSNVAESSN